MSEELEKKLTELANKFPESLFMIIINVAQTETIFTGNLCPKCAHTLMTNWMIDEGYDEHMHDLPTNRVN